MARQEILSSEYLLASLPKINENFSELYNSIGGTSGVAWADILDKPTTFPSLWSEVSGKPTTFPSAWSEVIDKPASFPSAWANISDKPATFPSSWNEVADKPFVPRPIEHNILDYGALCNGVDDDAPAIQTAIDALPATGGVVRIPALNTVINSPITINRSGIGISGTGVRMGKQFDTAQRDVAKVFVGSSLTTDAIKFSTTASGNVARGCFIRDISFGSNRVGEVGTVLNIEACDQFELDNVEVNHVKGTALRVQRSVKSYFGRLEIYQCGAPGKVAVDINGLSASSYSQGSVFNFVKVETCYDAPYMRIGAYSRANKFKNLGFESAGDVASTQKYLEVLGVRHQIGTIHTNKLGQLETNNPDRIELGGEYNTISDLLCAGGSYARHLTVSGKNCSVTNLTVDAYTAHDIPAVYVTGSYNLITDFTVSGPSVVEFSPASANNKVLSGVYQGERPQYITGGTDNIYAADPQGGSAPPANLPTINMMTDSGRFAGKVNPQSLTIPDTFVAPSFFGAFNGATISHAGKFIHNNSTNGGTAAALTEDVSSLLAAMGRTATTARYGVEFYTLELTAGTGTASPYTSGAYTKYLLTTNGSKAIFGFGNYATLAFWVRIKSGEALIVRRQAILRRNDTPESSDVILTPSSGWVHLNTQMSSSVGYNTSFPFLYGASGDVIQIACPALFSGQAIPGVHNAPLPTFNEMVAV